MPRKRTTTTTTMITMTLAAVMTLCLSAGCGHGGHGHQQQKSDEADERKEEAQERTARLEHEAEIAKKQAADAERFQKSVAVVNTIKVGDSYDSFYRKVTDARMALERVTETPDGRVERYSFFDNSTAFVVIVVKNDHIAEIHKEGVDH